MQLWSLLLPLALLCTALASGPECGMDERSRRARRDTRHSRQLLHTAPGTCATRLARGRRSTAGLEPGHVPRRRQQREVKDEEESLTPSRALYFSGQGDQLRLKADVELPRDAFTLQVWLKAEGGQRSPAVIAGRWPGLLQHHPRSVPGAGLEACVCPGAGCAHTRERPAAHGARAAPLPTRPDRLRPPPLIPGDPRSSADRLEVRAGRKSYVNFCTGGMAAPGGSLVCLLGVRVEVQVGEADLAVGFGLVFRLENCKQSV